MHVVGVEIARAGAESDESVRYEGKTTFKSDARGASRRARRDRSTTGNAAHHAHMGAVREAGKEVTRSRGGLRVIAL